MKNKTYGVYMAGSMEGRTYEELFYEHYYVRSELVKIGLNVFDPLLKERHKIGKIIGLKNCGMPTRKVYKQDLDAVEWADIIFWITGDRATEGSVTEVAWAGCLNRLKRGKKLILIVSPKRYKGTLTHFSQFHLGVKVVNSVDGGITFIKRRYRL